MTLSVSITREDHGAFGINIDYDLFSMKLIATEEELGLIVDEILDVMGVPREQSGHAPGSSGPWTVL